MRSRQGHSGKLILTQRVSCRDRRCCAGRSGSGDLHSQLAENRELLAERGQKLERLQDRTAMMESDAQVNGPHASTL